MQNFEYVTPLSTEDLIFAVTPSHAS